MEPSAMRLASVFAVIFATATFAHTALADDASLSEDMRFIQKLRERGENALALDYLERLKKNPSPELAKELPLETAKARLDAAGEEPDSGKRMALYAQARDEFQAWLGANPGHARSGEVKLDLAHAAVLQGRTQLSRAKLQNAGKTKLAEALKARGTLEDAGAQVQSAAEELSARIDKLKDAKTPAEKDLKKRLEGDRLRADFALAENLFDQGQTYLDLYQEQARKDRGKKISQAQELFEKLGAKDDGNPLCWQAKAWVGYCMQENDEAPAKVRSQYNKILDANKQFAGDGQRLSRYFRLLLIEGLILNNRSEKSEDNAYLITHFKSWIADYPAFLKSPEGFGVRFHLASAYVRQAKAEGVKGDQKAASFKEASTLLRQVEQSENDFTDEARRLKIGVMYEQQNGFTESIDKLKHFEDCFVRAQFEVQQIEEDDKKFQGEFEAAKKKLEEAAKKDGKPVDDKEVEKAGKAARDASEESRKKHTVAATTALERGLNCDDAKANAKGELTLELNAAKAMLAYYYFMAGPAKYKDCIRVGETLARAQPGSAGAVAAVVYAFEAHAEVLSVHEQNGSDAAVVAEDRRQLLDLAVFMEERWPKELPGDLARHQIALLSLREKDPQKAPAATQKAIEEFSRVTPTYPSYPLVQYQLALTAFSAEKNKVPPMPGDGPDGYRKRAMAALTNMPPPAAGSEPETAVGYFRGKNRLVQELLHDKKLEEVETLTQDLLAQLEKTVLDADAGANAKLHGEFEDGFRDQRIYSRWARADVEAKAGRHDKALELLNPVIDEINAGKHPQLQNNPSLKKGLLDGALRASLQTNQLERTKAVLAAFKATSGGDEGDEAGAAAVLSQLAAFIRLQMDDLRKKGDDDAVEKARKTLVEIVDAQLKPLQGDKLTPKLRYLAATLESSLDKHKEAIELLRQLPDPKPEADAAKQAPEEALYRFGRILLIRELRTNKELDEAEKAIKALEGSKDKPTWGTNDVDLKIERIELLAAQGHFGAAATQANALSKQLLPSIEKQAKLKDYYFHCYYLMVENAFRAAKALAEKDKEKGAKGVKTAAELTFDLNRKQLGFGDDVTRKRFQDLFDDEPEFKRAYLDAFFGGVEAAVKQAQKDTTQKDKAVGELALILVEMEKLWPDYGGEAAKKRFAETLAGDADLKAAYERQKAGAP
jgi:hypothetical protein